MAGLDEANARGVLATMQERLVRGPHATLGILPQAPNDEVRPAFLALTKIYHPARFARMSPEIQRLANEVFLGIKSAHDQLRQQVPQARTTTSPGMPVLKTPTGQNPVIRPPTTSSIPLQRAARSVTDRGGAAIPRTEQTRPMSPSPPRRPSEPLSGPVSGPLPGPVSGPLASPPSGPPTHAAKTPPAHARPPMRMPQGSPSPDQPFPRIDTQPGPVARLDPSTTMPPAPSVAVAIDLLNQRQWDAAKVALSALSAMAPDSKHVRALICFATGRRAQLEHRLDEARVELQRALQLDPDLAPAKLAMSELFSRRK